MVCLHFCTSEAWGGLELYACTLMAELRNSGCVVYAVCKPDSKVEEFLKRQGIQTVHLPGSSRISWRAVRFLRSLVRQNNVQVLHVHFHKDIWPASLALKNDSRNLFLSIYMGVPRKNDFLHRFIFSRVDAIFTSSFELVRRLPELYPVKSSRIHFLPYGRSVDRERRDEEARARIRAGYGLNSDEIFVGTMVRIDPGKGVMDFARSFNYITPSIRRKIKFLIVGEPTRKGHARSNESPFEEHCEAYLRDLEGYIIGENLREKILLAGFQEDIVGTLSALDIFVFPSRDELYSLVVLDAMCLGLPIVAARAGGNTDQIQDGINGFLYTVGDSEDMAEKISVYLQNPALRSQHGIEARKSVEEKHDMKKTIRQLLGFYSTGRT